MKLYILFNDVDSLLYEDVKFEDAKADAQQLLKEWGEDLQMTKDPIWLGVNEDENIRCLFEIETMAYGGIIELDNGLMSMSGHLGNNLGTRLNALDFNPSTDCCYQAYDSGEYDTGVINIDADYADYAEACAKEWGIELQIF